MSVKVHPLQEQSWPILRKLITDRALPLTKGMLSVSNGFYPSVEDILSTLGRYGDEDIVVSFLKKHADLVESTRDEVEVAGSQSGSVVGNHFDVSSWLAGESESRFQDVFELLKKVPVRKIEQRFSDALVELLGVECVVKIDGLDRPPEDIYGTVRCNARIAIP